MEVIITLFLIDNLLIIGPGAQPSTVRISGANVSGSATFTAFGSRTVPGPSFVITNDSAALETVESYQIRFTSPIGNPTIDIGPPTTIEIDDDDGKDITCCSCL